MTTRMWIYGQANYMAQKYFHVQIHELPIFIRRQLLGAAKTQFRIMVLEEESYRTKKAPPVKVEPLA